MTQPQLVKQFFTQWVLLCFKYICSINININIKINIKIDRRLIRGTVEKKTGLMLI